MWKFRESVWTFLKNLGKVPRAVLRGVRAAIIELAILTGAAGVLGAILVYVVFAIVVGAAILLFWYGVAVLVFRYAFGVELPNPFDWI